MRLLLTRPEQDAAPLAARLRALGHQPLLAPLLEIRPLAGGAPPLDGVQALLLTSANGARALPADPGLRRLPVLAVGPATAAAAREAGFADVTAAEGDIEALARLAAARLDPGAGALLHAAAAERAGDLAGLLAARGFEVRRAVLYEARVPARLPEAARAALAAGRIDAVLLYSPRTATTFAKLVRAAGVEAHCRGVDALCLSPAVAQAAAGLPWRALRVARRPEQEALLALLQQDKDGA